MVVDLRDARRILTGLSLYFIGSVAKGRLQAWQQRKLNDIHEKEFQAIQRDWEDSIGR